MTVSAMRKAPCPLLAALLAISAISAAKSLSAAGRSSRACEKVRGAADRLSRAAATRGSSAYSPDGDSFE